jgi:hypothetical protein
MGAWGTVFWFFDSIFSTPSLGKFQGYTLNSWLIYHVSQQLLS